MPLQPVAVVNVDQTKALGIPISPAHERLARAAASPGAAASTQPTGPQGGGSVGAYHSKLSKIDQAKYPFSRTPCLLTAFTASFK